MPLCPIAPPFGAHTFTLAEVEHASLPPELQVDSAHWEARAMWQGDSQREGEDACALEHLAALENPRRAGSSKKCTAVEL